MNKTDLLLQMMEQPQHYSAEEWPADTSDGNAVGTVFE